MKNGKLPNFCCRVQGHILQSQHFFTDNVLRSHQGLPNFTCLFLCGVHEEGTQKSNMQIQCLFIVKMAMITDKWRPVESAEDKLPAIERSPGTYEKDDRQQKWTKEDNWWHGNQNTLLHWPIRQFLGVWEGRMKFGPASEFLIQLFSIWTNVFVTYEIKSKWQGLRVLWTMYSPYSKCTINYTPKHLV